MTDSFRRIYNHFEATPEDVARQLAFFDKVPRQHRPSRITRDGPLSYRYDYITGESPQTQAQVNLVWSTACDVLWQPIGQSVTADERLLYTTYVNDKALGRNLKTGALNRALELICDHPLECVANPHGDFTLENVLLEGDRVVFIDPGHPRGMRCRENDEAKLMQSTYAKWDLINGTSGACDLTTPFVPRPIHFAFLLCHFVRLLNHSDRHSRDVLIRAEKVYSHLCGERTW